MKHVSVVVAAVAASLAVGGCKQTTQTAAEAKPADRVNAVLARSDESSFGDLCDVAPEPGVRKYSWPLIPDPIMKSEAKYRWINAWATWCKPCVDELPLLKRTFDTWLQKGQAVELTLVSVDADAQAARDFISARPQLPASFQLADANTAGKWLSENGLPDGAAIPVHMILDEKSRLLCARAGSVDEPTLERFRKVMFR